MRRVLVTGGSGFLGASLVQALAVRGDCVRVLDNHWRHAQSNSFPLSDSVEIISGDIRDFNLVSRALDKIDSVFHLAAINGTKNFYEQPDLVLDVALRGTLNLIEAAKGRGILDFFFASSSEVYQTPPSVPTPETVALSIPDPHNPRYSYAGGKILGEQLSLHMACKVFERVIVFRPHNVFGPRMGHDHVIPELIEKITRLRSPQMGEACVRLVLKGTGDQTRSFIYVDDFVRALLLLDEKGQNGEIYHIGTEQEQSIRDVALALGKLMAVNLELVSSPAPAGETSRRCPDTRKIRDLGFGAMTSFEEGLRKTLNYYVNPVHTSGELGGANVDQFAI